MTSKRYRLQEVANLVGKHRNTILSWLRAGKIPEVNRDTNGWRFWTEENLKEVLEYATKVLPPSNNMRKVDPKEGSDFSSQSDAADFTLENRSGEGR
ncbi:MAG: hypothetical protein KAT86_06580 [Candidatus Latescibacteria bacterium]|nr:hypothetical protein [Candidatus Latescibacterota bacterium]